MLPDGAIFCGECGRAVTAAANRRPVAPTPVEQAPPPPLQQPDVHGRRLDPADDAWLPEATLDPATRAWLTGADRRDAQPPAPVPVQRPDDHAPRSAPTHVHGAGSGLGDWTGQSAASDGVPAEQQWDTHTTSPAEAPAEPPLDPNAYPSEAEDPEVTRIADRAAGPADPAPGAGAPTGTVVPQDARPESAAPVWSPPREQAPAAAPAGPSWWVGRSNAAAASDATSTSPEDDASSGATGAPDGSETVAPTPQPGDTAVVEPLVDRRPVRPAPLVTPGSQATTCHVCGHVLEPDDIFCGECGAVRPAVTAAFTGQIVPLPMDRPDWAADDSVQAVADEVVVPDGGTAQADDTARTDADTDNESGAAGGGADSDAGDGGAENGAADGGAETGSADVAETGHTDGTDARVETDGADESRRDDAPDDAAGYTAAPAAPEVEDDTPRLPVRPRGVHAAWSSSEDTDTATPAPPATPVADDTAALRVPTAAPLPPLPGVTGPVLPLPTTDDAPTSADGDLEDDVEETRIVTKTPTHAPFVLHFSTGERFGVQGTGLVGRLPRPQPGERFDDLLTVHDPGKSVSKTHLELGRDGDDLWVSDRFSGNGTVVRHIDGSIRRCEPGRRYRVERGARVDIGEQFFLVQ
ncbi:FHA domain-containing protein [Curtobacterium sp. L1-20]